jgi:hypothetical protein
MDKSLFNNVLVLQPLAVTHLQARQQAKYCIPPLPKSFDPTITLKIDTQEPRSIIRPHICELAIQRLFFVPRIFINRLFPKFRNKYHKQFFTTEEEGVSGHGEAEIKICRLSGTPLPLSQALSRSTI